MRESAAQNLLSANCEGRRVTIGWDAEEDLRRLSDARRLTCPGCGATVVLHAGQLRAHHFAHLPGAVCHLPQSEPETEEHRAGKLLLARWLRERLPGAEVVVEAFVEATGQRIDVMARLPGRPERRFAFEFQCANLSAREWRRRHQLYREAGYEDLWLLGGSRLQRADPPSAPARTQRAADSDRQPLRLRTTELERALFWEGAPLLFLDSVGERFAAGSLARFRPAADAQAHLPEGKLSVRPLAELPFPEALFAWPQSGHPVPPPLTPPVFSSPQSAPDAPTSDRWLWEWLLVRHRVTPETIPDFFGLPVRGQEAFACGTAAWQAALYYRFVHRRVGDGWWLPTVEAWTRAYLPVACPIRLNRLQSALAEYQEILAAAGFLSLPMGYGRRSAHILADLTTLPSPPQREETLRLARYRRTLSREARADYAAAMETP